MVDASVLLILFGITVLYSISRLENVEFLDLIVDHMIRRWAYKFLFCTRFTH